MAALQARKPWGKRQYGRAPPGKNYAGLVNLPPDRWMTDKIKPIIISMLQTWAIGKQSAMYKPDLN